MLSLKIQYHRVLIYGDYISSEKTCDIIQASIKIGAFPDWCFLAIICNFVIIKICYAYLKELKPFGNKCIQQLSAIEAHLRYVYSICNYQRTNLLQIPIGDIFNLGSAAIRYLHKLQACDSWFLQQIQKLRKSQLIGDFNNYQCNIIFNFSALLETIQRV